MIYANQNAAFSKDKNQFFQKFSPATDMEQVVRDVDGHAGKVGYNFLLKNIKALEDEFTQMFAILQRQRDENKEAFWLYCYYCATLLETFYQSYSKLDKAKDYRDLKQKIKNHLLKIEEQNSAAEQSFIELLKASFAEGFRNLVTAPFHLSRIRDYVGFANLCRVYWVFCRLVLTSAFNLAAALHFIEMIDAILGTHTDVDQIISIINAPNEVLNYLSVGFFLTNLLIDGFFLIRHTFFPTDAEKSDNTTRWDRFLFELKKRHCGYANNTCWPIINFLTNFSRISHIPTPLTGVITAVFLSFDICLALYKRYLAKQDYMTKKAQYTQEKEGHVKNLAENSSLTTEQISMIQAHITMLDEQLKELEIDWRTKESTFNFSAAAAALFMFGFTASLLFTPPGMVLASFFVCVFAAAMYYSTDAYSKYQNKSLYLEQAQLTGDNYSVALKEYEAARNDFIYTLVKSAVMPTFFIATFAICWPAAIALTVLYVGYELWHASSQHKSTKEVEALAAKVPEVVLDIQGTEEEAYEELPRERCCFA